MKTPSRKPILLTIAAAALAIVAAATIALANQPETFEEAYGRCVTEVAVAYEDVLLPSEEVTEATEWAQFLCTLANGEYSDVEFVENADTIIAKLSDTSQSGMTP